MKQTTENNSLGFSVAALVLAMLGLFVGQMAGLFGVLAIIFGVLGWSKPMGKAAVIIGSVDLFWFILKTILTYF